MSNRSLAKRFRHRNDDVVPTPSEICPHVCIGCEEICQKRLGASSRALDAHLPSDRPRSRRGRLRQMLLLWAQDGESR